MAQLSAWRPEVVEEIRRRGRRLLQRWEGRFPGEFAQGRLSQDLDALDTFFAAERGQTCPVLEPGTGACLLYAHRPVPCRTFGPPLKFGTEPSNPCRLCFRRSTGEEVESCRWEPDPNGLEEALLLELGARPGQDWETMIACVVAEEKVDEDR